MCGAASKPNCYKLHSMTNAHECDIYALVSASMPTGLMLSVRLPYLSLSEHFAAPFLLFIVDPMKSQNSSVLKFIYEVLCLMKSTFVANWSRFAIIAANHMRKHASKHVVREQRASSCRAANIQRSHSFIHSFIFGYYYYYYVFTASQEDKKHQKLLSHK